MKTKLILCLVMAFLLACTITTPTLKTVNTASHIHIIATAPYGAEPIDWKPPLYVTGEKINGQLNNNP